MNRLRIYANYNYNKILKNANIEFGNGYKNWFCRKKVFCQKDDHYVISINKNSITISYYDDTIEEKKDLEKIANFINNNIYKENVTIKTNSKDDNLKKLFTIKYRELA